MPKYDAELGNKLRQLIQELREWAERSKKKKIRPNDIDRMEAEARNLELLINNREL